MNVFKREKFLVEQGAKNYQKDPFEKEEYYFQKVWHQPDGPNGCGNDTETGLKKNRYGDGSKAGNKSHVFVG